MNEFDYLAKAQDKMYDEKYPEVISFCNKALKINSELPDAYNLRGNANYSLGKFDYAVEDFSQAIKRDSQNSEHYYDRSWAYRQIGKMEDAILDISTAIDIEPKNSLYYYERARFEYRMGRYVEAIADYTKGIEYNPTEKKYVGRGNCYLELDRYDLAFADFNSALEYDPESHVAYYNLGLVKMSLEQFPEAIKYFEKALEILPKDDETCIRIGMCKVFLGKSDTMKYFNKAIKLNPCSDNYFHRIIARGRLLQREESLKNLALNKTVDIEYDENIVYNEKQAKDDIKDLDKIIAFEPDEAEFYELRAERYFYLGNYTEALDDCDIMIELDSETMRYYFLRGAVVKCLGRYQDAIKDCNKYIELNDKNISPKLLFLRACAEYKLKKYDDVISDLTVANSVEKSCDAYYYRGLAHYRLGHFKQAVSDIKKATELNPDVLNDYEDKLPKLLELVIKLSGKNEVNSEDKSKEQQDKTERPIGLAGIERGNV